MGVTLRVWLTHVLLILRHPLEGCLGVIKKPVYRIRHCCNYTTTKAIYKEPLKGCSAFLFLSWAEI